MLGQRSEKHLVHALTLGNQNYLHSILNALIPKDCEEEARSLAGFTVSGREWKVHDSRATLGCRMQDTSAIEAEDEGLSE